MAAHQNVWVFSENNNLLSELVAGACSLMPYVGGSASVIVAGSKSDVEKAVSAGAHKIYWLKAPEAEVMLEDYVPTIAGLLREHTPYGLLIGATKRGKAIAARLGAILEATVITDARNFIPDGSEVQVAHRILGGSAIRFETPASEIMLATVEMGTFEALTPETGHRSDVIEIEFVEPKWKIRLRERKEKPITSANLPTAKRVVCPGCGLSKDADLTLINELADVLSAEIGCTRPLAERIDGLSQDQHIGISGVTVKPDLYIGIGVSGQIQHTAGITDSRVVVAINKDRNAPIFLQADYGIVGDFHEIVPALIKGLREQQTQKEHNQTKDC